MQFSRILRRFLHSGRLLGVLGTVDKLRRPEGTEEASGRGGGVSQGPGNHKRLLHFFPVISYGGLAQPERPSVTGGQS